MPGVVFFDTGAVGCFETPTIIDPSNVFAITYNQLARFARNGALSVLQVLGGTIAADMELATNQCNTIEQKRRQKLLAVMRGQQI
jgi:hypothetical protein